MSVALFISFLARARMGAVVDARQVLKIDMRVDLRRSDVGVAEQLLHGAQIAAGLQ